MAASLTSIESTSRNLALAALFASVCSLVTTSKGADVENVIVLSEVYDMRLDPEQRANLADGSVDSTPFRKAFDARASFKGSAEAMQMDRELENPLRSLGYIQ